MSTSTRLYNDGQSIRTVAGPFMRSPKRHPMLHVLTMCYLSLTVNQNIDCRGVGGFNSSFSDTNNDLALYGLVTGLGLAGVLFSVFLPKKWYAGWWLGWLFLGPLAGMSVAFTMMILKNGEGMLVDSLTGRWILIGVFAIIGLVSVVATKWRGAVSYDSFSEHEITHRM